jgi:hypothetical protein
LDFGFVCGVAFCGPCTRGPIFALLKESQVLGCRAFAAHAINERGVCFYTPQIDGPPSIAELSDLLHVGHIYGAMPITPAGEHIRLDDYTVALPLDIARAQPLDAEDERDQLPDKDLNIQRGSLDGEVHKRPDRLDQLQIELKADADEAQTDRLETAS